MGEPIERIPVEIPGVEVVGSFNIKRFFDTLYNFQTKKHGVEVSARVTLADESGRAIRRQA